MCVCVNSLNLPPPKALLQQVQPRVLPHPLILCQALYSHQGILYLFRIPKGRNEDSLEWRQKSLRFTGWLLAPSQSLASDLLCSPRQTASPLWAQGGAVVLLPEEDKETKWALSLLCLPRVQHHG